MDKLRNTGLDIRNSRYIIVIVQYTSKISTKKLYLLMRSWRGFKQSLQRVNMRLCDSEVFFDLYRFRFVTPLVSKTNVPAILTESISWMYFLVCLAES